jgi:putative flippase GtrA
MLGGDSANLYILASGLTYLPLAVVNFIIQRAWIFNRQGLFLRFMVANAAIMLLVSLISRGLIDLIAGAPWGDRGGFIMAALLGSIPSFLIKRHWVFLKGIE